jgi:hypothetical protein
VVRAYLTEPTPPRTSRGCVDHETGQGDPLLFAARKPVAAFPDDGVQPVGEL